MATISGQLIFDKNRSATIDAGDSGISNIPIALQNIITGIRLVVLTDAMGNYAFNNVPDGSYRIVEAYGTTGGIPTPGDFTMAVVGPIPIATVPPVTFVTDPPAGTTNLDCITPNTILLTITGADVIDQNILNGPVIYTPIENILDTCATLSNINLITDASNGTFGAFSHGTPANTGPATAPYPSVTPDFTYVIPDPSKFTPIDGEYTVQNIMSDAMSNVIGAWWRIADHTTGNETGRMMVVNGYNPGAVFFKSTISVTPNTFYLFSTWILNLFKVTGFPPAQLGVRILDQNGNILFQQTLGVEIPVNTNAPEWKEIGTVINSLGNTQITVEFYSEGESVIGNDYAIDDVALQEIILPKFTPIKTSSTVTADVGDIVTYTVQLTNTCSSPLTDVFFRDIVPDGLTFIPGSVTVNGIPEIGANPNTGFTLPDVAGGSNSNIAFQVSVDDIPDPNPAINIATMNYAYTPVEGGIPLTFSEDSNPVPLFVEEIPEDADLAVVKRSNNQTAVPGQAISYTITVANQGPAEAQSVLLSDAIPSAILNPQFSVDNGVTFQTWTGSLNLGAMQAATVRTIIIRGTVSQDATGIISNTATVISPTPDPDPSNNTSTADIPVSVIIGADVSVIKNANPNPVTPWNMITFTIIISNAGPNNAENVILNDNITPFIINPMFSTDGGTTYNSWPGFLLLGVLPVGESRTVLIRGTVSGLAIGYLNNTAIVTSTTPDPNLLNNTSSICIGVRAVDGEADLSVKKISNKKDVCCGGILLFTIVVSNAGPADSLNVVLTDSVINILKNPMFSQDNGLTFQVWPGSVNLGTIAAGVSKVILLKGCMRSTCTGEIINTAQVSSITPDPNLDNNISSVSVLIV